MYLDFTTHTLTGYVNVYVDRVSPHLYPTRYHADKDADETRVACIKVVGDLGMDEGITNELDQGDDHHALYR